MCSYENIARICHEANKAYCETCGDNSQVSWTDTSDEIKVSAMNGVKLRIENPDSSPEKQHENWMTDKIAAGWNYGTGKSTENKTHPCLLPYRDLPEFQKKKDALFCAIVDALK